MSASALRSPASLGIATGVVLASLLAAVILPVAAVGRRRAESDARQRATELAGAAAEALQGWLQQERATAALLAAEVEAILAAGDGWERAARETLGRARRAQGEALRAAVLTDGRGRVLAAGEAWREGSEPGWLRAGGVGGGATWVENDDGGGLLSRTAVTAPPGVPPPLWVGLLWEPAEIAARLRPVVQAAGGGLVLRGADGEPLLRVPLEDAADSGPAGRAEGVLPGLALEAHAPAAAGPGILPWAAACLMLGGVGGVLAGWGRSRRDRLAADIRAAVEHGEEAHGHRSVVARLPGVGDSLRAARRRGAEEAAARLALEGALDRMRGAAILLTDRSGVVERAGGETGRLLGLPAREMVGRPLQRLLPPATWEPLAAALARAGLDPAGAPVRLASPREPAGDLEWDLAPRERGAGFVLLIREAAAPGEGEEGPPVDQQLRALVDRLRDGLAVIRDGVVETANPAFAALLGLRPEEVVGAALKRYVAPEDLLVTLHRLRSLPAEGVTLEVRLIRSDSLEPVHALLAASPMAGGAVLLLARDQTERIRGERSLLQASRRLDAILEAASDGLLAVESGGRGARVVRANRAFAAWAGVPAGDLVGRTAEEALSLAVEAGALPPDAMALATGGEDGAATRRMLTPRGRWVETRLTPLLLPRPGASGRVYSFRDITSEVEAEQRLQAEHHRLQARRELLEQANRELEDVNQRLASRGRELDELNHKLKRLDEMRSNLLANVSHELQTPLVSIRGYTEMILKGRIGPVTPDQEKGLSIALRNIDRLIELIDNLMEFSRAEGGLADLRLSTFPLRDLVEESLDLLRPEAARRGIRLQASYGGGEIRVRADRDRISQVLVNVIGNGIKYNRDGGEVAVEVAPPRRGFARVTVRDTGPGIPAEDLERVFERHFRVQRSGEKAPEGSGLGLSITRQILRMHGCTIRASSPPEGGAVFSFTLPLAREAEPVEIASEVQRRPSADSPAE